MRDICQVLASLFTSYHTLYSCSSERHIKNKIPAPLAKFFNFFHPLFYLIRFEYAVLRSVAFCVAGLSCSIGPSVITNLKWVKWGLFLTIFSLENVFIVFSKLCAVVCGSHGCGASAAPINSNWSCWVMQYHWKSGFGSPC